MLNQTDPTMMKSQNFEFMRVLRPDLADNGANLERNCDGPEDDALTLLRKFGERLLHAFVLERGGEIHLSDRPKDGKTKPFWNLVNEYCADPAKRWHIPEPERSHFFSELISEGNKATHSRQDRMTFSARRQLHVVWELGCWVWKKLEWGETPAKFIDPPKGGTELHDERSQKLETLKLLGESKRESADANKRAAEAERRAAEAERPCDISSWVCKDQQNLSAPKNFVGREFAFDKINQFLANTECRVLVIQGEQGRGKTAIIQKLVSEGIPAEIASFVFCFKDQSSQGEPNRWVRHLYASLVERWQLTPPNRSIKEADLEDLVQHLRNRITEVAEKHNDERLLFVIDAVDEAGPAEKTVVSFLQSEFPNTVQVIVTARRDHIPLSSSRVGEQATIQVLDLDDPDLWNKHQADGRQFITETMSRLEPDAINKVVQLSDGNFFLLKEFCRELRDVPVSGIAHHLRELSELKAIGSDLQTELYERTWKRLERLGADELDTIEKVAMLLANAHVPLSDRMIKDTLRLRRADWIKVQQHFGEYLDPSQRHPPFNAQPIDANDERGAEENAEPVTVFRLYHQIFELFVRRHLKDGLTESKSQLADYCREQLKNQKPSYEYAYALRFVVQHLIEAERSTELVELLTDLDFVEARFTSGQGYDLLEDYELALRKHPDTRVQFERRNEQDENLRRWVEELVDYSRKCTAIRGRHARGEISDPVAEVQKLEFPKPIDTSATIEDMKKAEAVQRSNSRRRERPIGAAGLLDFRAFIRSQFDDLREVPHSTIDIASNFAATGTVAEAVRRSTAMREPATSLRRSAIPSLPQNDSMAVTRIVSGVVSIGHKLTCMTPDARIGIGRPIFGGVDGIWNLRSGRKLLPEKEFEILGITIDGRYVATDGLQLFDLRTESLCREADVTHQGTFGGNQSGITPDGSLVVVPTDDALVIWNTESNELRGIELGNTFSGDIRNFVLCSSGFVAAVAHAHEANLVWTFVDLLEERLITAIPQSEVETFLEQQWFGKDCHLAASINWAGNTADFALKIVVEKDETEQKVLHQRIEHSDGSIIRSFDESFPFGELTHISADGRFGVTVEEFSTIHLVDLANGVWTERNPAGTAPDPSEVSAADTANSTKCNSPMTAQWISDEERLATELQFLIPEAAQSPGCVLLSPDGRFLVSDHRSTSQWEFKSPQSQDGNDDDASEWSVTTNPSIKQYIAATVTDLSNEEHFAIERPRRILSVTRDGAVVVFFGDCKHPHHFAGDQLVFWSLDEQEWLPNPYQLDFSVSGNSSGNPHPPFHPRVLQSPDGRVLLLSDSDNECLIRLNVRQQEALPDRRWSNHLCSFCFSPDGKYFVQLYDHAAYLWTIPQLACIGVVEWLKPANSRNFWIDCEGVLRDDRGRDVGIRIDDPQRGPAWVTGARLFRAQSADGHGPKLRIGDSWEVVREGLTGRYDDNITFLCPILRERAVLPGEVRSTINRITRHVTNSPVLELKDEDWDDEPRLDFHCPKCGLKHRSTPFYVDRQRLKFNANSDRSR